MFAYCRNSITMNGCAFVAGTVYPAELETHPAQVLDGFLDAGSAWLKIESETEDEFFGGKESVLLYMNEQKNTDAINDNFFLFDCKDADEAFDLGITLEYEIFEANRPMVPDWVDIY